jgi:aspartate carbamoyltransferase catalytic subunit
MSAAFTHRHLLGIEQLSAADIQIILDLASHYAKQNRSPEKKGNKLVGKTIVNLFFENSTRTRTSFEIAARRLGADAVNIAVEASSAAKGETLLDTVRTLNAMQVDSFVIRHSKNGAPKEVASIVEASVLNAGDGSNAHPTQALLDALTMTRHKGKLEGLKVAICGDVEHSRVARSNICLLKKFGAHPCVVAPKEFMPQDLSRLGVPAFESMKEGLQDADAIIMLRIQRERLENENFNFSREDYFKAWGLDHEKIKFAKSDAIVLHPGPLNREVEISSALADDTRYSVILEQVEMGVAVRMACLDLILGARGD